MKGLSRLFVHNVNGRFPIKIWAQKGTIEESCLEQAEHIAQLPFTYKWAALMPDTHTGKGMPIGGVIACDGAVIPNAVGVDIGCGMAFLQTDIPVSALRETVTGSGTLLQAIVGDILRNIPTDFAHYKTPQTSAVLDRAKEELSKYESDPELINNIEDGYFQVGTLGGGNHFIELQEDEKGLCTIMLHSGSRNFGYRVCEHFGGIAAKLNEKWHSSVPPEWRLPFLPADSPEGKRYLDWMRLSMDFAYENRAAMLSKVRDIFSKYVLKYTGLEAHFSGEINCHHNYAALENHFGKDVFVHRKGAISAREGEMGIIPGSMGSYSYIVRGKGDPDSFMSSSHGAGRLYSRTAAMQKFAVDTVINDLKANNVVLGKNKKADVAEESRFAYKDIDTVMDNQRDLTEAVKKLFTVGVVKG
ncbi:MAG: RtcB family protein [Oscillospiraceae bacterium]|nr:RtcB family protein [Oscillospiraceae bacterium]